jgi:hypothetical protein
MSTLFESERLQGGPVDGGGDGETVVLLIIREGFPGGRTDQSIHLILVIALLLERALDIGDDRPGSRLLYP